jgi:hypothetical protein
MAVVNSKTYYEEFAMTGNRETPEQGEEKWFRVNDGAFVVTTPVNLKMGRIIDISTDGIAFAYISTDWPFDESIEVSIFSEDCSFSLYKVPCQVFIENKAVSGCGAATLTTFRKTA